MVIPKIVFGFVCVSLLCCMACWAQAAPRRPLDPLQREALRWNLQNQVDGAELLVRNRVADHKDLERQRSDFSNLRVYDRFPLQPEVEKLRSEMTVSAASSGLKLTSLTLLPGAKRPKPVPAVLDFEMKHFTLTDDQIVQEMPIRVVVEGSGSAVIEAWMRGWRRDQLRFVEAKTGAKPRAVKKPGPQRWEVDALTYHFTPVRFPEIRFQDPIHMLPTWAQKDPQSFAQQEPQLWNLVARGRGLIPQAHSPALETVEERREFLLESARLSFYLSKTTDPKKPQP